MRLIALKDLAEIIRGVTFSREDGAKREAPGLIPVIRAGNIQARLLLDQDLVWVPESKVKDHQKIRENDIIMCTSSGSSAVVGKSAMANEAWNGSFGAFCAGIRVRDENCDPSYLRYVLASAEFRNWASGSSGANIKNIRSSELGQYRIPLPILSEQKRIATILDKADALRRKRQQAIELADQFLRSVFSEMFGDLVSNSKSWPTIKFKELISRGPNNGIYKPASAYGEGIKIIRIDGFYDGRILQNRPLRRVSLSESEVNRYQLFEKDIIINRVNSREYLGKSALFEGIDGPVVYESNMMSLGVDQSRACPRFIVDQLCSIYVKRQILRASKDAVNQSSINQNDVKEIELRLPPLPIQKRYVEIVEKSRESERNSLAQKKELENLFSSLSQGLLS